MLYSNFFLFHVAGAVERRRTSSIDLRESESNLIQKCHKFLRAPNIKWGGEGPKLDWKRILHRRAIQVRRGQCDLLTMIGFVVWFFQFC